MKQYIIQGERGAMVWLPNSNQLCYVDFVGKLMGVGEKPFLTKTYSFEDAEKYIRLSNESRTKKGFTLGEYTLIEIDLTSYVELIQFILLQRQTSAAIDGNFVGVVKSTDVGDLQLFLKIL